MNADEPSNLIQETPTSTIQTLPPPAAGAATVADLDPVKDFYAIARKTNTGKATGPTKMELCLKDPTDCKQARSFRGRQSKVPDRRTLLSPPLPALAWSFQ